MTKPLLSSRFVPALISLALLTSILAGCAHDSAVRSMRSTPTSGGSIADGNTPPPGDNAALCSPNISGPHQWPLNVSTADTFYPDPKATPVVRESTPSNADKGARQVTITIKGSVNPYPGQTPHN